MDTDSLYVALAEENLYDCNCSGEKRRLGKVGKKWLQRLI